MLINGRAYGWADIRVGLLGGTLTDIKAISFKTSKEKVNHYGAGDKPNKRGYGVVTPEASITLGMKGFNQIENAVPSGKTIFDIARFPITVSWLNEDNDLVTYELAEAEFTEFGYDASQGDTEHEVELPLIVSEVKRTK